MEFVIFIVLFIGVIAVTALLFSGWALVSILKALASGIQSLVSPPPPAPAKPPTVPSRVRCTRPRCLTENPPGAHFCRKCGMALTGAAVAYPTAARRVSPPGRLSAPARPAVPPPLNRVGPPQESRQRVTL